MVVMVMGLPGCGKSFFAARLAELIEAVYINSDRLRKELNVYYSREEKLMVYDEMLRLAEQAVTEGRHLVLDATFYAREIRDRFKQVLQRMDLVVFIEVVADEELIRERLKRPREDSDANFEVYQEIKEDWQPVQDEHLVLRSTGGNIDSMLDQAVDYLQHGTYDK